jgi:hypothetical protein
VFRRHLRRLRKPCARAAGAGNGEASQPILRRSVHQDVGWLERVFVDEAALVDASQRGSHAGGNANELHHLRLSEQAAQQFAAGILEQ